MDSELVIYEMQKNLLLRVYPAIVAFPKSEKYSMCQNLKNGLVDSMKFIRLASTVKSKRITYLQEADGYMRQVQTLFDICRSLKYISENFFDDIDLEITKICIFISKMIKASKN